ncbi:MAG: hypothetical protein NT002_00665 [candidate division Zixibacteria bacterium]|nr:hypothetical protein [candidate division Zixibacteria bacterium]
MEKRLYTLNEKQEWLSEQSAENLRIWLKNFLGSGRPWPLFFDASYVDEAQVVAEFHDRLGDEVLKSKIRSQIGNLVLTLRPEHDPAGYIRQLSILVAYLRLTEGPVVDRLLQIAKRNSSVNAKDDVHRELYVEILRVLVGLGMTPDLHTILDRELTDPKTINLFFTNLYNSGPDGINRAIEQFPRLYIAQSNAPEIQGEIRNVVADFYRIIGSNGFGERFFTILSALVQIAKELVDSFLRDLVLLGMTFSYSAKNRQLNLCWRDWYPDMARVCEFPDSINGRKLDFSLKSFWNKLTARGSIDLMANQEELQKPFQDAEIMQYEQLGELEIGQLVSLLPVQH